MEQHQEEDADADEEEETDSLTKAAKIAEAPKHVAGA
jgi:hypothetical protein